MKDRLIHACAELMTRQLLDIVQGCLREEEQLDAFREFYMVCRAGIEALCIYQKRIQKRLNPIKNHNKGGSCQCSNNNVTTA